MGYPLLLTDYLRTNEGARLYALSTLPSRRLSTTFSDLLLFLEERYTPPTLSQDTGGATDLQTKDAIMFMNVGGVIFITAPLSLYA